MRLAGDFRHWPRIGRWRIASFIYGSTATRTITPNLRGLPAQILDMAGSTRRLDHTLSYDQNANLAGIVDGLDGMETRSLVYDARDRLTSITGTPGSIGNESFTYDPLDNVRRAVAGGADRRFIYNASTLRLSQITTINSPSLMDYTSNDRGELTSRMRRHCVHPIVERTGQPNSAIPIRSLRVALSQS